MNLSWNISKERQRVMYKKFLFFGFIVMFLLLSSFSANASKFIPEQDIMPVSEIKPGMTGYMLTVLKGETPEKIPVKVISIAPQKPGRELTDEILIKLTGKTKLAQGMSGSPVYINNKLIGAVRSGWELSDHTLAFAAPIESMCRIFDTDSHENNNNSLFLSNVSISGVSINNSYMQSLANQWGINFVQGLPLSSKELALSSEKFKPGDTVSALLVWGDIEAGAVGTVTATSKDGRFLAFGHDFNKAGEVSYPAAKTYVHDIVNSLAFPFKLASPKTINGTFTQDREAGVGGKMGKYPPSISAQLIFKDLDTNTQSQYKFRVISDEFMSRELLIKIFQSLAEEAWGRKGQGTMSINLHVDGKAIPNGWSRKDIFYSDTNILKEAFEQAQAIINAYMIQPFSETMPAGFVVTIEATQKPKVMLIEDVVLSDDTAKPGDEIGIDVKLRGWRMEPVIKSFTMKIPDDASEGVCELIVRGGDTEPMGQIAVDEGWKSIDSIQRMLTEFKAADANNELILELEVDRFDETLTKAMNKKKHIKVKKESDLLPEQEEYLSETKSRRIDEGTLRIFATDYYIDGMMKRIIHIEK